VVVIQRLVRRTERCATNELVDRIGASGGLGRLLRPSQVLRNRFPDQRGDGHTPAGGPQLQIAKSVRGRRILVVVYRGMSVRRYHIVPAWNRQRTISNPRISDKSSNHQITNHQRFTNPEIRSSQSFVGVLGIVPEGIA
jgi:hypothetical protein